MTHFKQQYKNKGFGFGDTEQQRILRAYNWDKSRREIRAQTFCENRKLLNTSSLASPQTEDSNVVNDERMEKLLKWKAERDKRKKLERAKKKPVFKVGIVHHAPYSPASKKDIKSSNVKSSSKSSTEVTRRVTRATEKRLLAKAAATSKSTIDATKKVGPNSRKHPALNKTITITKQQISFAPADHKFKPPSGLPNMPLFGFVTMEPTPSEKGDFFIQNKLANGNIFDINNILTHESDPSGTSHNLSEINNFVNSKLSLNEQKLAQFNKEISHPSEDISEYDKSMDPKLLQNKRKSSRLNRKNLRSDNNVSEITKSINSRLSSDKQKHLQKLNEQTPLINNTSQSNQSRNSISLNKPDEKKLNNQNDLNDSKLSLNQEAILNSSQKENLLSNIDTRTPSQSDGKSSEDLIFFSPYLTLSRGKSNARKEQQIRLGIGRSSEGTPTKNTVMQNLNISIEEEERTAQYFKFRLNKETNRLMNLCNNWLEIQAQKDIPEDAIYEISQAIGQTKLLINKKFQRFSSLVTDCETGRGEMLVTCRDLQGFWDMTYMEVKNCDLRFEKLEQRRNKGWEEDQCTIIKPVTKKRMPAKKQITSVKPSSLRSFILAAKKRRIVKTQDKEDLLQNADISKEHITPVSTNKRVLIHKEDVNSALKTRRSKSLFSTECKLTPARCSGSGVNLLQKVLSSKKSKNMSSPFTLMKISQMCKTPEVQLDNTISYVNSDQTPGKSILKKSEESINKEARIKSTCKVNFDDLVLNESPVNEALKTKLSLSAALSKIDSLDMDELSPEDCINAEKKLNFDTDDSDSDDFESTSEIKNCLKLKKNKSESSIQNMSDFVSEPVTTYTTLSKEISPSGDFEITSSKKKLRHHIQNKNIFVKTMDIDISPTILPSNVNSETTSNATNMGEENDFGIRSLRNRTIMRHDTPKINRTSKANTPKILDSSKKENKSPIKSRRKSSIKYTKEDKIKYLTCLNDNKNNQIGTYENTDKRRKSSRKSVAFTAETCLACAENKPVLPMTPHSKRRSKVSNRGNNTFDEHFTSCPETPERPPSRVRRSRVKN